LACFFFQAEDGIRDFHVTGVQTCALPISFSVPENVHICLAASTLESCVVVSILAFCSFSSSLAILSASSVLLRLFPNDSGRSGKIGRASCRERVSISTDDVTLKGKRRVTQ